MAYLFFDTETTGLPKNWKAPMTQLDNWPRVIQLAWMVCNDSGEVLFSRSRLIKPDGWIIPAEKFWIDNGFSTERNKKMGHYGPGIFYDFMIDLQDCELLVSHNMSFDYNVLGAEFIRYGLKSSKKIDKICTKEISTDYCKLPGRYGYKWPKLEELHIHLFGKNFEGAHDAMADVVALKDCFFELKRLGVI